MQSVRFFNKKFRSLASSLESIEKLRSTEAVAGWFAPSPVKEICFKSLERTKHV